MDWKSAFVVAFVVGVACGEQFDATVQVGGLDRKFIVYEPNPLPEGPMPFLYAFHGLGSNAWKFSKQSKLQETADRHGALLVFPDSLTPPCKNISVHIAGKTIGKDCYDRDGKRWDIGHILNGKPLPGFIGKSRCESYDLEFVDAISDAITSNYSIDESMVFSTGHSFGAFFSYYLSACGTTKVKTKAFASHSGGILDYEIVPYLWHEDWPLPVSSYKPAPGLEIHSKDDPTVKYERGAELMSEMKKAGIDHRMITMDGKKHTYQPEHNEDQWEWFVKHSVTETEEW